MTRYVPPVYFRDGRLIVARTALVSMPRVPTVYVREGRLMMARTVLVWIFRYPLVSVSSENVRLVADEPMISRSPLKRLQASKPVTLAQQVLFVQPRQTFGVADVVGGVERAVEAVILAEVGAVVDNPLFIKVSDYTNLMKTHTCSTAMAWPCFIVSFCKLSKRASCGCVVTRSILKFKSDKRKWC
jgi:hypothetical protein